MRAGRAWIDTGALLALASPRDPYHARAVAAVRSRQGPGREWVSSVLVLGEFHRLVLYRAGPAPARAAVARLLADPATRWLEVGAAEVSGATSAWLERFPDQDYSLTDAVSFELMRREGIVEAFAFDRHYLTAGFRLIG